MNRTRKLVMWGVVALMAVGVVEAKTVALWPLTTDRVTGEVYGYSLINAADDLSSGSKVAARALSLGWNLPPNPDETIAHPRFDPSIWGEVYGADATQAGGIFASTSTSPGLAAAVLPTHDFTVEGWVRFGKTPGWGLGQNEWWVIAYANGGSAGSGGWNFSLRRRNNGRLDWVHYQSGGVNDVQLGETIDVYGAADYADKEAAFTNRWMHLALVFRYDDPEQAGKSTWTLYTDGVKAGSASQNKWTGNASARTFELGGRSSQAANRARLASFAYWRVSDVCLATNEFLNAGGTGSMTPGAAGGPTKMYWKLGRGANGGLDTRANVGGVTLHGCLFGESANVFSATSPSAACAFTGNPPNPTVSLPDGNVGSIRQDCQSCFLQATDLGRNLTLTNSFTVEGWVRPRRMRTGDPNGQYVFSTRKDTNAWACQFYQRDGQAWYLEIYAQDSAGTVVANSARISSDLRDWHDWKHLALVYDVEGGAGKGEWRMYLDGTLAGTVVNASKPARDTNSINFYLGGRQNTANVFYGNLDCFRVSKAALAPSQFLNATENAQAATDVLALWPLNAQNGVYFDCADVVGSYPLANKRETKHLVAPSAEAPVIANPDASATFLGDPVQTDGSAGFWTIGGANAYLATTRSDMRDLFCGRAFTLEGYFRRTQAVNGTWELLFGTTAPESSTTTFQYIGLTSASMQINFTYRSNGFVLFAGPSGHSDVAFPNTAGAMPVGVWQHVALSYSLATNVATWKLYLDGVHRGTLTGACTGITKPGSFLVGGRPYSSNSFKGAISNVRFSQGALEPEKLLCATNATPVAAAPETLAYWPFEATASGLDLTSRILPAYTLSLPINLTQSDARAAVHPGLPDDSATFQGDARVNVGSAAFTEGHANTALLGDHLDLNGPFTVEGWVKWSHAVTNGLEFLLGTYRYTLTQSGWRLCFDTTGATPRLRIFARGYAPVSVCVDGCFDVDVSFLENTWTHLALTYDNRVGNGTWTLFADGRKLGTVENLWSPNAGTFSHNYFKFGEAGDATTHGFTGLLDMWRVSKGVRTPASFLYQKPYGAVLFVR